MLLTIYNASFLSQHSNEICLTIQYIWNNNKKQHNHTPNLVNLNLLTVKIGPKIAGESWGWGEVDSYLGSAAAPSSNVDEAKFCPVAAAPPAPAYRRARPACFCPPPPPPRLLMPTVV